MSIVVNLTRNWTDLYTWRLPHDLRDDRRAEIESDLWEHQSFAHLQGIDATSTAFEILLRFVFGIPADCLWRLETGAAHHTTKRTKTVNMFAGRSKILIALTAISVLMILSSGVGIIHRGFQDDVNWVWMLWGIIPTVVSAPSILAGFWLVPKRPGLGIALVAFGCFVTVLTWFWMFMITVPISIALIALSWYQAKKSGWRSASVQPA